MGVCALVATLAGGGAAAQAPGVITDPVWRSTPSAQQRSALYPMRAMAGEKIGVAVVRCTAKADGKLAGCSLVCETPEGWGFGKAGLQMMKHFRLDPLLADGRSVAGETVIMPLRFNPPFLAPLPRCDGKVD